MQRTAPTIPVSVPVPAAEGAGVTDVSVSTVNDSSQLDSKPDARANPPKPEETKTDVTAKPAEETKQAPAPEQKKGKKKSNKK